MSEVSAQSTAFRAALEVIGAVEPQVADIIRGEASATNAAN